MAGPLVSVVTPTWRRHDLLLGRCLLSVQGQDYPAVEHVIVSDGPDEKLAEILRSDIPANERQDMRQGRRHPLWYYELPEHPPEAQWGHYARLHGIGLAAGKYIAYLDDDNSWRTGHVAALVAALEATGAGFAYGQMHVHGRGEYLIGGDPPAEGHIDTSMIIHRRDLLDVATWRWYPGIPTVDWDLVSRWMAGGATWVRVPAVTCDYYFR